MHQTVSQRVPQRGTIIDTVVELYRMGLSPREIAKKIYGSDNVRFRRRIYAYLQYARLTGRLSRVVSDDARGEVVDPVTGVVVREREVGETFIPHSRPVSHSAPFMGSYRNVRQLKASLKREEVRVVNVMSVVDRLLGPLNLSHESVVREEAMFLARKFAGSGKVREVAAAAVFTAVARYRPGLILDLMEVLDSEGVDPPARLVVDMVSSERR